MPGRVDALGRDAANYSVNGVAVATAHKASQRRRGVQIIAVRLKFGRRAFDNLTQTGGCCCSCAVGFIHSEFLGSANMCLMLCCFLTC